MKFRIHFQGYQFSLYPKVINCLISNPTLPQLSNTLKGWNCVCRTGHKREWKLMHRYGLHMFTTEDGLQGNVGVICQPAICSRSAALTPIMYMVQLKTIEKSASSANPEMRTVFFLDDRLSNLSLATHMRDCGACSCIRVVSHGFA